MCSSISSVLLGTGIAFALGAASWARALLAAGVALALQIGCNIANDYFDGLRGVDDVRCGPPRLTTSSAVAPAAVMALALASFAVAVALGLALLALCGQWWMLGLGAAAIAAAWFYTGGLRPAALTQWLKGLQGSSALLQGALKKPAQTA